MLVITFVFTAFGRWIVSCCITRIDNQKIYNDGKEDGMFIPSIVIVSLTVYSITSMENYGMMEKIYLFLQNVCGIFEELVSKR